MTAHIDEQIETEDCECDPHSLTQYKRVNRRLNQKLAFWRFSSAVLCFYLLILIVRFML